MAYLRALARVGLGLAVVATGIGCTAEASWQAGGGGPPPPAVVPQQAGRVTVDFTVSGTHDPAICGAHRARELEVTIVDSAGQPVATSYGACEGFSLSVDLPEGRYHAQAILVDEARRPVTTSLPLSDLDVVAGTDLTVQADFPAGSFL